MGQINVKFKLKSPNKNGKSLIMVRAYTKFFDLRYSTGLYIDQNHWDEDYQLPITDVYNILKSTAKNDPKEKERKDIYLKVINEQLKRDPGYRAEMGFLVNQLMKYKAEINRIYETLYSISPIVKKDRLKLELDKVFRMDRLIKQTDNRFFASFDEFLTVHEKQFKPTTIQKYKTTIKRLRQYEVEHNNKLEFASINMEFYESFRNDLLFDGLTDNSIAKYFNTIKAFLRWSYEREYHTNGIFLKKQFSSKSKVKNDIVTLNKDEINALRDYDFSDNVRLDRVRDIFLFMIYTGQRISDITNFNPQDVRNGVWKFHQYKTGTLIEIDLNITKLPLEILKKYDFKMPIISEQKFNSYLKEVGEKVLINEVVTKRRYRGSEIIETRKPKYLEMSSHMARRSCVTLLLESGVPATTIMKLTGHKNIKTLMKYENTSQEALNNALVGVFD